MSIFSRIFKIGQASVNKVLDKMEKPEVMLDQAITDKQEQISDAKKAIQQCIATERKTKALLQQDRNAKLDWERKAETALRSGREDLAVLALKRASEHEEKANALEENWRAQREAVDSLKQDIQKMDDELADFKRNKDFIIAQSKAAEVKKNIYEAKARISGSSDADDLMARMKAKAERKTYEAEAAKEMADTFEGGDALKKEFDELGASGVDADVEDKLSALKAKLGGAASSAS